MKKYESIWFCFSSLFYGFLLSLLCVWITEISKQNTNKHNGKKRTSAQEVIFKKKVLSIFGSGSDFVFSLSLTLHVWLLLYLLNSYIVHFYCIYELCALYSIGRVIRLERSAWNTRRLNLPFEIQLANRFRSDPMSFCSSDNRMRESSTGKWIIRYEILQITHQNYLLSSDKKCYRYHMWETTRKNNALNGNGVERILMQCKHLMRIRQYNQ